MANGRKGHSEIRCLYFLGGNIEIFEGNINCYNVSRDIFDSTNKKP